MTAKKLKKELQKYTSLERKKTNEWFFKTGKGEYGEHDKFLGIRGPEVRAVAKKFADLNYQELQKIISSPYNEERSCSLIILVNRYKKKKTTEEERKKIYKFFIKNLKHINNWNLVDISTPHIMGEYLTNHKNELKILDKLSSAKFHWNRRVAILATWGFIKKGNINVTLKYVKKLLHNQEDLMHKAVGWMLREAWKLGEKGNKQGKVAQEKVEQFLLKNYQQIPRTTLRYAIERMEEKKRKRFLQGDFKK